jgi:hypothetical protein
MKFAMKLPLAVTALTFGFTFALAIQTDAAIPAAATTSGFMLAQAMVPPTGMMDKEHPMPMNERYLRRFPQPVRVGDLVGLPILDLNSSRWAMSGRSCARRRARSSLSSCIAGGGVGSAGPLPCRSKWSA